MPYVERAVTGDRGTTRARRAAHVLALSLAALVPGAALLASEHGAPHWGYGAEDGPANWGKLSPDYALCSSGKAQTPIDLVPPAVVVAGTHTPAPELEPGHGERALSLLDNGHTIQVTDTGGTRLTLDGVRYELLQFHFHDPSEHTIGGRSYPMELHLVHTSADGRLAVVGVLIEQGAENVALAPLFRTLPAKTGEHKELKLAIDLAQVLPRDHGAFRYAGSLTTPPCSEGVQWLVLEHPITLSREQIAAFTAIVGDDHRPVQPLNGRTVTAAHLGVR